MTDLSKRAARVVSVGKAAYGERWQSKLAKATGVPQSLLAMIAGKDREPTDDVIRRIAEGLIKEADRVRAQADKLDKLAGKLLRELEE